MNVGEDARILKKCAKFISVRLLLAVISQVKSN